MVFRLPSCRCFYPFEEELLRLDRGLRQGLGPEPLSGSRHEGP
jgi:hypothetical protein